MTGIRSPLDGMGLVITALCAKSLGNGRSAVAAAIARLSFTMARRVISIESSLVRLNLLMKWALSRVCWRTESAQPIIWNLNKVLLAEPLRLCMGGYSPTDQQAVGYDHLFLF
jgi:hypothetical protein